MTSQPYSFDTSVFIKGRRDLLPPDAFPTWAMRQNGLFVPLDEDIQAGTTRVLAQHPKLAGTGGRRHQADPFVIGLASARGGVVVTEETPTNNRPWSYRPGIT